VEDETDVVTRITKEYAGVASLAALEESGVPRRVLRSHVRAGRWRPIPGRGMVLHNGPLAGEASWRAALLEVGPAARLGGITALQACGLKGFEEPWMHIWVPKSSQKGTPVRVSEQVCLHETRRWGLDDALSTGVPRSNPAVATLQAALWARSARQAALCLVMPVQQRLVRADVVAAELERVKRHEYRSMLRSVIGDITDGAQSLNEIDFAVACRRRGLPEPSRQVVRRLSSGRCYLDVRWDAFRVAVEVNGAGHDRLDVALRDEVRMVDLQSQGDAAIPLSVLTLRCDPEPFFEALQRLLVARGWRP
jgi:hypothetical protein